ncbi:MAG: SMC-Scp complex subunit ScpB [Phycisphaeraceae bacterium]|nr:SMC-Scp complex subunit ScpB [Phycisphaeraceae bacterium]
MDEATPTAVEDEHTEEVAEEVAEEVTETTAEQKAPVVLPEDLDARVEAALMTSERPMTAARVAEALGAAGASGAVEESIEALNTEYERTGRSFRIEKVAGAWQVVTLSKYADVLDGLKRTKQDNRLSASQLETLAIVAYKQPIVRAQVEAIRGAASGEVLRLLMDRHLVKVVGRSEEIGRPMLYGTTKQFLEVFGLGTLKDLPEADELKPI